MAMKLQSYSVFETPTITSDWRDGLPALRSAVQNGGGNGALRKIGAVQEGVLRQSFLRHGRYLDQSLWAILDDEWYRSKAVWGIKAS